MFWALLTLILARAARRKHYYYYYHFGGHWRNKHWKNDNKHSEEHFFHQRCEKTSTYFEMAYDYLIFTFYWFISAGKNHFSPPNSPFWPVKCATMPDKVIIIFVFTSMLSSCLQGRQYPTAFPAIQPGVSSFDSNAEQRLQMALVHFMHEYFVVSKQE